MARPRIRFVMAQSLPSTGTYPGCAAKPAVNISLTVPVQDGPTVALFAYENVVVDLAPALGFKGPGIETGCHQLHRGLSSVADSDDFAVPRNPVATARDPLVRFVDGVYEDAGTGVIGTAVTTTHRGQSPRSAGGTRVMPARKPGCRGASPWSARRSVPRWGCLGSRGCGPGSQRRDSRGPCKGLRARSC